MSAPAAAAASEAESDSSSVGLQRVLSAWLRPAWPLMWKRPPSITDGAAGAAALLVSSAGKQLNSRIAVVQRSLDEAVQTADSAPPVAQLILQQPLMSPLHVLFDGATTVASAAPVTAAVTAASSIGSNTRSTRSKRGSAAASESDSIDASADTTSASSAASTHTSTSLPSSNFSSTRFPVLLSSICIEFELTRYTRLGTRVMYRASSGTANSSQQVGVYTPLPHTDENIQHAAVDSHGFVTLESVWPGAAPSSDGTFTASLSELLDAIRTFYQASYSELEWRFLRRAVDAGTLSATDPGVQELLLPEPVVSAVPHWPEPKFNWPEKWITRSLELMELDTSGTLIEKGMRIYTHESVGQEKYGSEQSFGSEVRIKVVLESREVKEDLPIHLILTSDWSEEDASLLAQELWTAHPLQDDPDRPMMLQRPGGLRMTLACVPERFVGSIALPLIWSYREFLNTLRGGSAGTPRRPEIVSKIESVLQRVHRQRLERVQSPGVQAMAQAGKRGGKARKGEPVSAAAVNAGNVSNSADASASAAESASVEREPCMRYQLLGGRQRIALMDVTTATLAALGQARTAVDIKIDIELE